MDNLERSELTASIRHIARFDHIRSPGYGWQKNKKKKENNAKQWNYYQYQHQYQYQHLTLVLEQKDFAK